MSTETVRITFVTKCEEYALPPGDFEVSAALNRKGLSDALNQVFELSQPVPFDFKIGPHFLRQTLGAAIKLHQLSTEDVIAVAFFPAFRPPVLDGDKNVDAWVSCLRLMPGNNLLYSLYDGSIRLNDDIYSPIDEISPAKCVAPIAENQAVSGDLNGNVTLFDLTNQNQPLKFSLSDEPIHAIATFPTLHNLFIIGTADGTISMWPTSGDREGTLLSVTHGDSVQTLQWIDENNLLSASLDKTLRVWDVDSFAEKSAMSASCGILSASMRGPMIVTSHPDRSIRLWDTRTSEHKSVVREFKSHTNWVSQVKWVNDEIFVSGGYDGGVKLWNIGTQVPLYTIAQHDEKILALDATEEVIVAAGSGQQIHHFTIAH